VRISPAVAGHSTIIILIKYHTRNPTGNYLYTFNISGIMNYSCLVNDSRENHMYLSERNEYAEASSDCDNMYSNHYASLMAAYNPTEIKHFQPTEQEIQHYSGLDHAKASSSNQSIFQSSELFKGLEFLPNDIPIDPSLFVTNYAPLEPYTILPLSFRTALSLDSLVDLINNHLKHDPSFQFEAFASESVWHIQYAHNNTKVTMQINIYRGKSGMDHVVEGQRCDGDAYLAHAIFHGIKARIELPESEAAKIASPLDFFRLVSV
jgi:hypothetical protein